jgi:NAD(P)-dependent dehydrogenase (short-subunit alcohol dehydrogenase family)
MNDHSPVRSTAATGSAVSSTSTTELRHEARHNIGALHAYSAAKHGVIGLTQTAALDYGPKGIRVNTIVPGPVLTDGGIGAAPAKIQEQVAQALPLRRLGRPEEIARLAAWLLSDAACFVNGATISIDGGKLAGVA